MVGLRLIRTNPIEREHITKELSKRGIEKYPGEYVCPVFFGGKKVFLKLNKTHSAEREIKALELVGDHPNIPSIYETFEIRHFPEGSSIGTLRGIVMDYFEPRDFGADTFDNFFALAGAVSHCVSKRVCHNDITVKNLVFGETPALTDFDIADTRAPRREVNLQYSDLFLSLLDKFWVGISSLVGPAYVEMTKDLLDVLHDETYQNLLLDPSEERLVQGLFDMRPVARRLLEYQASLSKK